MTRLRLAGAEDLLARAGRTRALLLTSAMLLVAALATGVWLADGESRDPAALTVPGRQTVLVLDVSTSIRPALYREVDATLAGAIHAGGTLGLVAFSDSAYELLAPGTPARELEGVERYYRPLTSIAGPSGTLSLGRRRYLQAPWAETLSSGTRISTGIEAARLALERDARGRGAVVLLSDLGDALPDLPALAAQVELLEKDDVKIQVVALSPRPSDLRFFENLLAGGRGSIVEAVDPGTARTSGAAKGRVAYGLVAAGVALLLIAALNELLGARLVLRPGEGS